MLIKMKADGVGTGLISRELALDIGEAVHEPNVGTHIPGVTNILADHLSRREDDSVALPSALIMLLAGNFQYVTALGGAPDDS